MNQEIDFLRGERPRLAKKLRFFRLLKVGSLVVLLAYCLIVGIIFSYWFYLNRQTAHTNQEISSKKQNISRLKDIESLQIVLKQRLSILERFFSSQKGPNFGSLLKYFDEISDEVALKELTLSKKGEVNLSGESPNAVVLGKFLDRLRDEKSQDLFSKITLSSLERQDDGNYLFVLQLETKK